MKREAKTLAKLLGLTAEIQDHHAFLTKHGWRSRVDQFGECWSAPWDGAPWIPESAIRWQLNALASDVLEAAGWTIYGERWMVSEVRSPQRKGTRYQKLTAGL